MSKIFGMNFLAEVLHNELQKTICLGTGVLLDYRAYMPNIVRFNV